MSWLSSLYDSSFIISLIVDVVVLACVIPAYRRSRHSAFLYLMFSYLIAILGTTADHTMGRWHMSHEQLVPYRTLRYFAHFAVIVLLAAGIISLARAYLSQSSTREGANPSV